MYDSFYVSVDKEGLFTEWHKPIHSIVSLPDRLLAKNHNWMFPMKKHIIKAINSHIAYFLNKYPPSNSLHDVLITSVGPLSKNWDSLHRKETIWKSLFSDPIIRSKEEIIR